jgi:hypothetical protein
LECMKNRLSCPTQRPITTLSWVPALAKSAACPTGLHRASYWPGRIFSSSLSPIFSLAIEPTLQHTVSQLILFEVYLFHRLKQFGFHQRGTEWGRLLGARLCAACPYATNRTDRSAVLGHGKHALLGSASIQFCWNTMRTIWTPPLSGVQGSAVVSAVTVVEIQSLLPSAATTHTCQVPALG